MQPLQRSQPTLLGPILAASLLVVSCGGHPADGGRSDGDTAMPSEAGDVAIDVADSSPSVEDGSGDSGNDVAVDDAGMPDASPADTGSPDTAPADVEGTDFGDAADAGDGSADVCPPDRSPSAFGSDLRGDAEWIVSSLPACSRRAHAMVVPGTAVWRVQARRVPPSARLYVYGPTFRRADAIGGIATPVAATEFAGERGELTVDFTAAVSGEYVVVVERDELGEESELEIRASCTVGCGLEATRYPVVLLHGFAGADSYFGVVDYYHDVLPLLSTLGYAAFTPVVDPVGTSEQRAEQLVPQLEEILVATGAAKVNLIAHSQGGLDARVLISGMGWADRVASLTTVATPHRGVPLPLVDFFAAPFDPEVMEEFAERYPNAPGVRYWSWSARTCGVLAFGCQAESGGETVDAFLIASYNVLRVYGDNDGVVTTDSMPWGEHLGLLFADHFDEVGQIADGSPEGDPFDHRAFYAGEARRLAAAEL